MNLCMVLLVDPSTQVMVAYSQKYQRIFQLPKKCAENNPENEKS